MNLSRFGFPGDTRITTLLARIYLTLGLGALAGLFQSPELDDKYAGFWAAVALVLSYRSVRKHEDEPLFRTLIWLFVAGPLFMGRAYPNDGLVGPQAPSWADQLTGFWYIVAWVLFVVCAVAVWENRNRTGQVRTTRGQKTYDPEVMGKLADSGQVFGTPGQVAGAAHKFGKANVAAGARGERIAADLFELEFQDLPNARIFHGLAFPGSRHADVDHAIMLGNRVAFIDAKAWKPGNYAWDRQGRITRDGELFSGSENHMDVAVDKYRDLLPRGTKVHGWVMLVSNSFDLTVTNTRAHRTDMGTSLTVPEEVKAWLMAADHTDQVDTAIFAVLSENLKG